MSNFVPCVFIATKSDLPRVKQVILNHQFDNSSLDVCTFHVVYRITYYNPMNCVRIMVFLPQSHCLSLLLTCLRSISILLVLQEIRESTFGYHSMLLFIGAVSVHVRSRNLPSTFSVSRWVKVSGVGVFLGLGLGFLLYYLHRTGRIRIAIKPK